MAKGILSTLFRAAANPEDPTFPLGGPKALGLHGGAASASGVKVNRDNALTLPAFFRAVTLIAGTIAKVPIVTYARQGKGKRDATEHPAYELQYSSPAPDQVEVTAFQWKQTKMLHVLMRGNGYTYIHRRGDATPFALQLLECEHTYPVREDGRLLFVTRDGDGWRKLPAQDVLHWHGPGWDGLMGYDVLTVAAEAVGEGLAKQGYSSRFFANSARPGGVIEVPGQMNDPAKKTLIEGWSAWHTGLDNAHKTGILDRGAKFNPFTIDADKAQLIESRKLSNRDVANVFGLPAHKVGDDGVSAFASLEQEEQNTINDCYDLWFCMIEAQHRLKLLGEAEKRDNTHTIEFLRQALVRGDLAARSNAYRVALGGHPYMTPNEVRGLENQNPLPGGDELPKPLNMGQGGADNAPNDPADPPPGNPGDNAAGVRILDNRRPDDGREAALRAAVETMAADAAVRVVRRMQRDALRAAKAPGKYLAWLEAFRAEQAPAVAEMVAAAAKAAGALRGAPVAPDAAAACVLNEIHRALSDVADRTPASQLERKVNHCLAQLEIEIPAAFARHLLGD